MKQFRKIAVYIFFMLFLFPLFSYSQGSSLGLSKSSIINQISSDSRLSYDRTFMNYNESYVKAVTADKQIAFIYEFSSDRVIKEHLINYNISKERWARIAIGIENDGWKRISITNEGGNYANRYNKGNIKLLIAYSPDDKVLGIITTMGNY